MLVCRDIDLFYGSSQALRQVSMQAEVGKVTCVLGRNGVGKTSLIRAIAGQVAPAKGQVIWNDRDITKAPAYSRAAAGVALVPQGREIFPLLTVEENLRTSFAAVPTKQREILPEIYDLFPVLESMLGRRGGDLSGGQQQQLAIARALVMRPTLLVLDEPTEGIQPSIIKDIARVIAHLRDLGNMAIVLVEQYFEFASDLADSFVVMDRGEVVLEGAKADFAEADVRRHLTV
ncbi:MAG: urea ABC transporter ATP-binding subunit UrtE [Alphaproteobacteria bacterium]